MDTWWKLYDGYLRGGNRKSDCGGNIRTETGGFTGRKQAEVCDGYAVEKTSRKCSQLDCDLRPYEQLWTADRAWIRRARRLPRALDLLPAPAKLHHMWWSFTGQCRSSARLMMHQGSLFGHCSSCGQLGVQP